jgi:CARDB
VSNRAASRVLGIAVLVVLLAALVGSAQAAQRGKPDLVISSGSLEEREYAFIGKRLGSRIDYELRNKGTKRAGASVTSLFLKRGDDLYPLDRDSNGAIDPRDSENLGRGVNGRNGFDAGKYGIGACADVTDKVNERNETNNCKKLQGTFYSTYENWTGSFAGVRSGPFGSTQSWTTTSDTTFGPGRYVANGLFRYTNDGGSAIRYTNRSGGGGCSVSGTGTFPIDARFSSILLNYEAENYTANATTIPGSRYTVTQNCGGVIHSLPVPVGQTPALLALQEELVFGHVSLPGRHTVVGITFQWDLRGR